MVRGLLIAGAAAALAAPGAAQAAQAGRDHHPDDPDRAAGLHGGVPNAPGYQLWLSAIGLQPQDNKFYNAVYPWLGFRIGVIGNP